MAMLSGGLALLALGPITVGTSPGEVNTALYSLFCWLLVGSSIAGTVLLSHGIGWSWLFLLGLQPLWICYAVMTEQYALIASALAYGLAQLNGFLRSRCVD